MEVKILGVACHHSPMCESEFLRNFLAQIEAKMEELFTFLDADCQVRTPMELSKQKSSHRHSQTRGQTL